MKDFFEKETDEEHSVSINDIIKYFEKAGYKKIDRRTLYSDIEILKEYGIDIIKERQGNETLYYCGSSEFEAVELKILIDFLKSSRIFTEKKVKELIRKLSNLANNHERKFLIKESRNINIVRMKNKKVYYNIDKVYNAMKRDKKICFKYQKWSIKKKLDFKNKEKMYQVSPWDFIWDNERYYLIAYDEENKGIRHYRVDKMAEISILDNRRSGIEMFENSKPNMMKKTVFGMFGGEKTKVKIKAKNKLIGVFIDHFGEDIDIIEFEKEYFVVEVEVVASEKFYGWIYGIGTDVKLLGPPQIIKKMKNGLQEREKIYKEK